MRNRVAGVVTAWFVLALAGGVTQARSAQLTVGQIIARNVAARGGLAAWRRVRTLTWVGHIDSANAPMPNMQFTMDQARPNKTRFAIDTIGEHTVRVFDGVQGWKLRPAPNGRPMLEPYGAQELRFAEDAPGLDGPLIDYKAKGGVATLEGVDRIYGNEAYRIGVVFASGENDHVWVDAHSFLDLRYDRSSLGPGGKSITVSMYYHDYKSINGLQMPTVIETGVGSGKPPDRLVIERVLVNPLLDARTFAMPGAQLADARPVGR